MTTDHEYDLGGFFDEAINPDGSVRGHYAGVIDQFLDMDAAALDGVERDVERIFREQGITFTVYGEGDEVERTWPMDPIPRILPGKEWDEVEQGLAQRVTALNRFLEDMYVGEQAIVNDGVIPRWLVATASGYEREAVNVQVPNGARCLIAGIDLVRGADGSYYVLEDNLRNPSGISYVIENRAAVAKLLPRVMSEGNIRPVNQYGRQLLAALRHAAPPAAGDDPTVVVLTPGVYNSAYFEHAFLARQMGVELVVGSDLVVDDHVVSMRTTHGLERVDVIYRRIDDSFLDPVVFRQDSSVGVHGLMAAARAGNVTISNSVGNGLADDKAVYAYVPQIIDYYLGEKPLISNVETYLLWDPDQRATVLNRLDELVIKPVAEAGGYGIVIGPKASAEELDECRRLIENDPRNYIAQEVVQLSRMPCVIDGQIEGRHLDLRPFVLVGETVEVVAGGLTRVAMRKGSLIVNSSQGGGSKDTWVVD